RQPLLGKPLQDPEIPAPVPQALRLHPGRQDLLPRLLRLVSSGPPPSGHRPDDTLPGPLRPSRRGPRRPPGNSRPSLPRQPEPLRQQGPDPTPKAHRRLDQPAKPQAPDPSLIYRTGCLIVVDTFRVVERDNLRKALRQVQRNKGAPGVDGMTVEAVAAHLKDHWPEIRVQLLDGTYR